jgi:hypothetical protein
LFNQANGAACCRVHGAQSAERLLSEALSELRSPGSIGSSLGALQSLDLTSLAAQQSLLEADNHAGPEQTGQLTQYKTHVGGVLGNIAALALGPGPAGTVGNLCVAANGPRAVNLDVYVGCKERQLKQHSLDVPVSQMHTGAACFCSAKKLLPWLATEHGVLRLRWRYGAVRAARASARGEAPTVSLPFTLSSITHCG